MENTMKQYINPDTGCIEDWKGGILCEIRQDIIKQDIKELYNEFTIIWKAYIYPYFWMVYAMVQSQSLKSNFKNKKEWIEGLVYHFKLDSVTEYDIEEYFNKIQEKFVKYVIKLNWLEAIFVINLLNHHVKEKTSANIYYQITNRKATSILVKKSWLEGIISF